MSFRMCQTKVSLQLRLHCEGDMTFWPFLWKNCNVLIPLNPLTLSSYKNGDMGQLAQVHLWQQAAQTHTSGRKARQCSCSPLFAFILPLAHLFISTYMLMLPIFKDLAHMFTAATDRQHFLILFTRCCSVPLKGCGGNTGNLIAGL